MIRRQNQDAEGSPDKPLATAGPSSSSLDQELCDGVNSMMQRDGKGEVTALVLLALRKSEEVTVVTTDDIKQTVKPLMQDWGARHLLSAHQHSGTFEAAGMAERNEEDVLRRYTCVNDLEAFPQRNAECSRLSPPENTTRQPQKLISSPKHEDWIVSSAFRVDNEQDVGNTLLSCLYYLQQQVLKRIAKVWIKGICPRKQAKYPYRNKRGEEEGRERAIPPWWPSQDDCTFKEPDHVDKFQRLALCLHFLRLRPSTEQLKGWNFEKAKKPLKTHNEHEWVAFLRGLAPLSIVDELYPNDPEKAARRKKVMERMYEIAGLEEEYKDGVIDGNTMVQPLGIELQKTIVRSAGSKRSRACSVSSDTIDDDSSDSEDEAPTQTVAKNTKAATGTKAPAKAASTRPKQKKRKTMMRTRAPPTSIKRESDARLDHAGHASGSAQQMMPLHGAGTQANTTLNTSFGSAMSDAGSCDQYAITPASPLSDIMHTGPGFRYAPQIHNGIQCHRVYGVPEPHFATMPSTPIFAPNGLPPFGHQQSSLGGNMATLPMDMTFAGLPHAAQHARSQPASPMPMHGLPTQKYRHWPEAKSQTFSYEVQSRVPSAQAQHAGFAVGSNEPQTSPAWAAPFHPDTPAHGDHDMGYNNANYGTSFELPPAALPASVERGFTGHASGVGDSACPPGYGPFF